MALAPGSGQWVWPKTLANGPGPRPWPRRAPYNLALTAALLLLTGCLEMQSQDIHIRCDEANDRIDVALVYRQLKVNTSPHQAMFNGESSNPLDRVLKSLRKVRDGGQFALGPDATFSDPTGSDPQADNIPVELRKHLDVEYGGLITSPSNEFIGYQFLRVNDATEVIISRNPAGDTGDDGAAGNDDATGDDSATADDDESCAQLIGPNGGSHNGCVPASDVSAGFGESGAQASPAGPRNWRSTTRGSRRGSPRGSSPAAVGCSCVSRGSHGGRR